MRYSATPWNYVLLWAFCAVVLPAGMVLPLQAGSDSTYTGFTDSVAIVERYYADSRTIIDAALQGQQAFERLAEMCDRFGPRLSGTRNLEDAIDWVLTAMKQDGFDVVRAQEVMVPHWSRGEESATLLEPVERELCMLGLGGSIGTPPEGIRAEVLIVQSFEELLERKAEAQGKIVLYNVPFSDYGKTVRFRFWGAVKAAQAGAVACLVRSVGPFSMQTPHTGSMSYEDSVTRIPAAAITSEDALMLERWQRRGEKVVVRLKMEARMLPDAPSRNIIAEIKGSEKPEEVIVFGGHIDSWDVGTGAMDDGGGCIVSWQALKLLRDLGLRPRRTLRVVLWTNEENGLGGAKAYAEAHKDEQHILAIESDAGVFKPVGFGYTGAPAKFKVVRAVAALLGAIDSDTISVGGGGADVAPLSAQGVDVMGLEVDRERYFWYHHTPADTPDKLDPHEMNLCVASMAVMVYVLADLP